ncbi:hypothetical protein Pmani_038549 [Petrolisthes manimaculis]|uniref:Uncharacterized protein n=1 Tax=Petrolisthes manimaculis TaxID=1843537 RepID=A0AAE1TKE7_9EUCA|nr:hypothetical protein Pmani_038549 [Petrolisthes manimaculis]
MTLVLLALIVVTPGPPEMQWECPGLKAAWEVSQYPLPPAISSNSWLHLTEAVENYSPDKKPTPQMVFSSPYLHNFTSHHLRPFRAQGEFYYPTRRKPVITSQWARRNTPHLYRKRDIR